MPTRIVPISLHLLVAAGLALAPIAPAMASSGAAGPPEAAPPAAPPPSPAPAPAPAETTAPAPAQPQPPAAAPGPAQPPGDPAAATPPPAEPAAATAPPAEPAGSMWPTGHPGAAPPPPVTPTPAPTLAPAPAAGHPSEALKAPERPPPKGTGMIITGATLLASSALPGLGAGAYCITRGSDDFFAACSKDDGVSALTFGVIALLVGTPLLTFGAIRAKRYSAWKRERHLSIAPSVGRTARGTHTGGLALRF